MCTINPGLCGVVGKDVVFVLIDPAQFNSLSRGEQISVAEV